MRILVLLTVFVGSLFILSCNRTSDLTKNEIYQIFNEIIADDSLRIPVVCWTTMDLPVSDEFGFTEKDKSFIKRQKEIFEDFTFESKKLRFWSQREKAFAFIHIDTTCNAGFVNHLSFPLISSDRKRVVFRIIEDCHCMLGEQGGNYLFIKQKNGHWKFEKSFDTWIS